MDWHDRWNLQLGIAGTNWNATPVSNLDTILSYTSTLAASVAIISNNDVASPPFKLNQLSFTNAGPASGTAPTITLTGNELEFITNTALATPTLTFNTTGTIKPTIEIQNNLLLTNNLGVAATTDGRISGVISGSGSLTKSGAGTLTLSGAAVNGFNGGVRVNAGTLAINLSNLGTPTDLINSGNALTLGGGTFSLTGKSGVNSLQTFNGTSVSSGYSAVSIVKNSTGFTTTAALGNITQSQPGGVLSIFASDSTSPSTTLAIATAVGTTANAGGWIGSWVVVNDSKSVNARWANLNGSNQVVTISATTATAGTMANVTSATAVYTATGTFNSIATPLTAFGIQATGTSSYALGANLLTTEGLSAIGGVLTITGSTGIQVGTGNELVMMGVNSIKISAPIANKTGSNSNVTFAGASTLTLDTAVSTYTGTTTLNSGTMTLGLANVLNSASSIVVNAGTLGYSTFDQSVNAVKLVGGTISGTTGTLTSATNFDLQNGTVSGILAGGVGVNKTTSGTVTLSGANLYSGGTTISAGIIKAGNATALGANGSAVSVTAGATLDLNGATMTNTNALTINGTGVSGNGALINNNSAAATYAGLLSLGSSSNIVAGAGDITLSNTGSITATGSGYQLLVGGAKNTTINGSIDTGTGTVFKQGAGTLTLTGANSYTGLTTVSVGTLTVGNNAGLGTTAGDTTVSSGAAIRLANGVKVTGESILIAGVSTGFNGALQADASATAEWAGTVKINSSDARVGAGTSGSLKISGAIIDNGAFNTINIGAGAGGTGEVIISAASGTNTYTGNTTISRGTLKLGADNTLPTGTTLDVDVANAAENAIFDLNGFNQTVAGLQRTNTGAVAGGTGGAIITNSGAADRTLTINQSATTSFNGIIQDGGTNKTIIVKDGAGTLALYWREHLHRSHHGFRRHPQFGQWHGQQQPGRRRGCRHRNRSLRSPRPEFRIGHRQQRHRQNTHHRRGAESRRSLGLHHLRGTEHRLPPHRHRHPERDHRPVHLRL